jgi:hypothetical protein
MFSKEEQEANKNRNICYDLQSKYNISIEDLRILVDAAIAGWGNEKDDKR